MSAPGVGRLRVRDLGDAPGFRALPTAASGATGPALAALVSEIGDLELLLSLDFPGVPRALAAYRRQDRFAVEIAYLAVAPQQRHAGVATSLVHRVRELSAAVVVARTGDGATGFCPATGFHCSGSPPDPCWPGRRRWPCVLPPPAAAARPGTR